MDNTETMPNPWVLGEDEVMLHPMKWSWCSNPNDGERQWLKWLYGSTYECTNCGHQVVIK